MGAGHKQLWGFHVEVYKQGVGGMGAFVLQHFLSEIHLSDYP